MSDKNNIYKNGTLSFEEMVYLQKEYGLYVPENEDIEFWNKFNDTVVFAILNEVRTVADITSLQHTFFETDNSNKYGFISRLEKEITKKIELDESVQIVFAEEIEEAKFKAAYKAMPVQSRPYFLYTLENGTQPPLNFDEENYPDYFNVVPDDEMPSFNSQQRLEEIMQRQTRMNSANPGWNKVITPEGFSHIVQRPPTAQPLSVEENLARQNYNRPKVPVSQTRENMQNTQPNLAQPQPQFQNLPKPVYNLTPQKPNQNQSPIRNKSLDDLLK